MMMTSRMRRYLHKYLILLYIFYIGDAAVNDVFAAAPAPETEINRWIATHAQRANSSEVAGARYRVVGDLNGDARDDVAVLYTLKSRAATDGELRYLAVFVRDRRGLHYRAHALVGGPGIGEVNRATVLKRSVVLEMLVHARGDPVCCPTRPATRHYRLVDRKLVLERSR